MAWTNEICKESVVVLLQRNVFSIKDGSIFSKSVVIFSYKVGNATATNVKKIKHRNAEIWYNYLQCQHGIVRFIDTFPLPSAACIELAK